MEITDFRAGAAKDGEREVSIRIQKQVDVKRWSHAELAEFGVADMKAPSGKTVKYPPLVRHIAPTGFGFTARLDAHRFEEASQELLRVLDRVESKMLAMAAEDQMKLDADRAKKAAEESAEEKARAEAQRQINELMRKRRGGA